MTVLDTRPPAADERDPQTRLLALFDEGTVEFLADVHDSAVAAARGEISGVPAYAFATDPRLQGGALARAGCQIVVTAYDRALAAGVPIVGIWQSGGARLTEGVLSLDGVGRVFAAMTAASGRIPQISLVVGAAAGGAAYGPALTDVVVMAPDARVFVTGPDVVRSVTGEDVTSSRLGGPEPHGRSSGVAHIVARDEEDAYESTRRLAALLGRAVHPPVAAALPQPRDREDPGALLPPDRRRAYDVRPVLGRILDEPPVELHAKWAPNVVTSIGRLGGRTIGVVANNPCRMGGCLDATAADKAARFVRMCDAFGMPIVVVVDVPGYLPGVRQEWDGVVRRGAKLLHAFAEATVPTVTLVTRKAFGGAYIAMNSRSLGATAVYAWPDAEIGVMGALPAVRILHRRRLAEFGEHTLAAEEQRLAATYEQETGGLHRAVEEGLVDAIIRPEETRDVLAATLAEQAPRRGLHTNVPL